MCKSHDGVLAAEKYFICTYLGSVSSELVSLNLCFFLVGSVLILNVS